MLVPHASLPLRGFSGVRRAWWFLVWKRSQLSSHVHEADQSLPDRRCLSGMALDCRNIDERVIGWPIPGANESSTVEWQNALKTDRTSAAARIEKHSLRRPLQLQDNQTCCGGIGIRLSDFQLADPATRASCLHPLSGLSTWRCDPATAVEVAWQVSRAAARRSR